MLMTSPRYIIALLYSHAFKFYFLEFPDISLFQFFYKICQLKVWQKNKIYYLSCIYGKTTGNGGLLEFALHFNSLMIL